MFSAEPALSCGQSQPSEKVLFLTSLEEDLELLYSLSAARTACRTQDHGVSTRASQEAMMCGGRILVKSPQAQGRCSRCWPGSPAQQSLPTSVSPVLRLNGALTSVSGGPDPRVMALGDEVFGR